MKKSIFNICYSADNNYAEQLGVSIASILKNSAEDEGFNFFVLTAGIDAASKKKLEELKKIKDFGLEFILVNSEEFKNCKLLNKTGKEMPHYHVTLSTYFRYKIGSLLKNISKVLYLDCDIIVKKSLKPLFETDLGNNLFGMVPDAESESEAKRLGLKNYFNAGVMLINLDLWRKENLEEKLFKYTKEHADKILWQDQDVINLVCANKIQELKNGWNYQFFLYDFSDYKELVKELKDVSILHLAGRFKPWIEPFEHPVLDEYYFYLGLTPWAEKIREYKYRCFGKCLEGNIGGNNKSVITKEELFEKGLKPVYSMLDEAYDFTKKGLSFQKEDFDRKIDGIYSEITNNYEFTKSEINKKAEELKNNISSETDNKIGQVYSEITNNYEFTKSEINKKAEELKNNISSETDNKIGRVYSEITNNYEFTKSEINKKAEETNKNTDLKIEYSEKSVRQRLEEFSEKANSLIDVRKKEFEDKISGVYSRISEDYELIKQQAKEEHDKIELEISRLEGLSSANSEDFKAGFEKLLKNLTLNNDKLFEIMNEYHGKQERGLIEKLDILKADVINEIINPKFDELKSEISSEINSFKEREFREIKEYTDRETETSRTLFTETIEQMKKDYEAKERQTRLDFEKQLLDLEMKYKKMQNVLNPLISFMKRFNKPQKPDERKQ